MDAAALDAPYDRLAALPRAIWLHGVVTSAGEPAARLADAARWFAALDAGELPPADADFGDASASAPLRDAVGTLGLPQLCRHTPALAEQVLRSLLWHLDRIVDHQPRLSRPEAIEAVTAEFRAAWHVETAGLEQDLSLLLGLGNYSDVHWDSLRGQLRSRGWAEAQAAAERLAQLPALAELIRQLGRSERSVTAPPAPQARALPDARNPSPLRAVETRLPDAPGEITGIRWSARPELMLGSEAAMLRHPVLKKLWRARHAEGRLLSWQTEAVLTDWRSDPLARPAAQLAPEEPERLERGPILLCLDTSGSMRGAPEKIAKAVVIAALQAAQRTQRACRLIAFGGPGEVIEQDLQSGEAGLAALMALMAQSFDGGTDVQTPIERAIAAVHDARWRSADLLIVSDGEFGCVPQTLDRLDEARQTLGLRVQGILVGDRETMGLLEVCDHIHWEREWRRFAVGEYGTDTRHFSPVHSKSLTALFFPNALSARAARHRSDKA
jgi:uncharacterized protein with von Willebrand factor type A (vWA) domain